MSSKLKNIWYKVISNAGLELHVPIIVRVEEFENEVIVTLSETETFASGITIGEATRNFKSEIFERYKELNSTSNEELGEVPLRWKKFYDYVFGKQEQSVNSYDKVLNEIKELEIRYEMKSDELLDRWKQGMIKDTADIARWLILIRATKRIKPVEK